MSVDPQLAKRSVPGAPPPTSVSKTQKKKRRAVKKDEQGDEPVSIADAHEAALVEKAPSEADIKSGAVADGLVVDDQAPTKSPVDVEAETAAGARTSPVVEMLGKRIKALGKKISRIHTYSSKPASELNEDQRKTLSTLPSLEAVHKELEDTKKAVEAIEADETKAESRRRVEAEQAAKAAIADAVAASQKAHVVRAAQLLDFLNLHFSLANSDPSIQALNLAEQELAAIDSAGRVLLHKAHESKPDVLSGFFLGEGDFVGVPYLRLLEVTDAHMNPLEPETALTEAEETAEAEMIAEAVIDQLQESLAESEDAVTAIPPIGTNPAGLTGSTSFTFMQESEIEVDPVSFENGAEWVDKEDIGEVMETVTVVEETNQAGELETVIEVTETVVKANNDGSWADDEGDLPTIEDIHAHFGTSGSATPAADPAVETGSQPPRRNAWGAVPSAPAPASTSAPSPAPAPAAVPPVNGAIETPIVDEDGFVQSRGGRGRARGASGFRGGRGGERGGFRGGRGGERGGFRGVHRGEFWGGDRGGRGRSGDGGLWRGGPDGEHRGRGRGGRGRGGERGGSRGGRPDSDGFQQV